VNQSLPHRTDLPQPSDSDGWSRRLLLLLLAVVGAVTIAGAGVQLWHNRQTTFRQAEQRVQDTARLLEEHVRGTLRSTEFIVTQAAAVIPAGHGPTPRDGQSLRSLEGALAEKGSLWVFDRSGLVILGAADSRAATVDISDSPVFRSHRDGAITMVGPLARSPLTGTMTFTVSRRMGEDQNFRGIALATIEAGYFTDFYMGLGLGPNANLGIAKLTGELILRQPLPQHWSGGTISGGPVMQAIQHAPQGVLRAPSPIDGIERIVAYRVLPDLGVVVTSGIAIQDILGDWRRDALTLVGILVVAGGLVGVIAVQALRSINREMVTIRTLEDRVKIGTDEARRQAEEAQRANDGKTRFLAAASHDLRQPLQAAGMFIEVLAAQIEEPRQAAVVDKLRRSVDATNILLNALLDVTTLECGKVQPDITIFPLMPLLASLAEQVEPDATARGLSLRVVETGIWVASDRVLLERLLRNLVTNALRYTDKGSVLLGCRRCGPHVGIQVVDTGMGIPADKLETIFEDFTRLVARRPPGDGSGAGLGLGLGVVRRMANLLGHQIVVKSTIGHGSNFSVRVDRASPPGRGAATVSAVREAV
jgi:signal transduction histidine kinase